MKKIKFICILLIIATLFGLAGCKSAFIINGKPFKETPAATSEAVPSIDPETMTPGSTEEPVFESELPLVSDIPTEISTDVPTIAPTEVTSDPTAIVTEASTKAPTVVPTAVPTKIPTAVPTKVPTAAPTKVPTAVPTKVPTAKPTPTPTPKPVKYYIGYENKAQGIKLETTAYKSLSEAKSALNSTRPNYTAAYYVYGFAVYDESKNFVYAPYGKSAARILAEAKYITDYVCKNKYTYAERFSINPIFSTTEKKICCDTFVAWVLYNAGFTGDMSASKIYTVRGNDNYTGNDIETLMTKMGFTKITNVSSIKPGDIMLMDHFDAAGNWLQSDGIPDHMFVYGGSKSGSYYRYDCGNNSRIKGGKQPSLEDFTIFYCAYRAPN